MPADKMEIVHSHELSLDGPGYLTTFIVPNPFCIAGPEFSELVLDTGHTGLTFSYVKSTHRHTLLEVTFPPAMYTKKDVAHMIAQRIGLVLAGRVNELRLPENSDLPLDEPLETSDIQNPEN